MFSHTFNFLNLTLNDKNVSDFKVCERKNQSFMIYEISQILNEFYV